jgi:hypothetical protein
MEKKKPGTVSELFRSHPKMAARIQFTQKNVQELLAAQPQYVITTSEFREVKQDLTLRANARKATPEKSGPTLRRPVGTSQTSADGSEGVKPDQDERPTLKRRSP